jgi:hypothetical protein
MPARFWVGMWTVLFILIIVIFNLSACVKYITRFTEDSFATLIAIIFIVEAFKKLFEIGTNYPVNYHPGDPIPDICSCNAMCNTNVTEVLSCDSKSTGKQYARKEENIAGVLLWYTNPTSAKVSAAAL